jgi:ABC-2 type transport system ATP-binding protein/lipopolysaccharide transport system ATP-binding protein
LNGTIIGMSRRSVRQRFDEIVEFAGVDRFIDTPVKRYSSGMYLRLAFAVAAHLDADIMVVDEVLAVGDAEFQRKCLAKLAEVERSGRTILFVSHNIDAIARLCSRAVWLERGRVVQDGPTAETVGAYLSSALEREAVDVQSEPESPLVVKQLRICDATGRPANVLPRHEPFTVHLDLLLQEDVSDLNVSITIENPRGVRLLDEAWSDRDPHALRRAGHYHLTVTMPPVLNEGDYTLGLWAGSPYETFIWAESILMFRMEGSAQGRPERALQLNLPWATEYEPLTPG